MEWRLGDPLGISGSSDAPGKLCSVDVVIVSKDNVIVETSKTEDRSRKFPGGRLNRGHDF
ncbi:hypothetical protein [Lysinibacillus sp. TE18511]